MAEPLSRRGLLAGGAAGLAVVGLGEAGPARAEGFDWKKHAGTTLRVVTLKFPLSEISQARLADFGQLTGIKVQWEMLPEDMWRQKVKVQHLGGATDLDVFLSYYGQEGQQFLASGWYTDMAPMMRDPALTNPDFVQLGKAYGWHAERVEATAQFEPAFARALAADGPTLLHLLLPEDVSTSRTTLTALREAAFRKQGA